MSATSPPLRSDPSLPPAPTPPNNALFSSIASSHAENPYLPKSVGSLAREDSHHFTTQLDDAATCSAKFDREFDTFGASVFLKAGSSSFAFWEDSQHKLAPKHSHANAAENRLWATAIPDEPVLMLQETLPTTVELKNVVAKSEMFDEEDLADFVAARDHDFSPNSLLLWSAQTTAGVPKEQTVQQDPSSDGEDIEIRKRCMEVGIRREALLRTPALADCVMQSEMFDEEEMADFFVARSRDFSPDSCKLWEAQKLQKKATSARNQVTESVILEGHMKREVLQRSLLLAEAPCESEMFDGDDLADLDAARDHDYSPESVAKWEKVIGEKLGTASTPCNKTNVKGVDGMNGACIQRVGLAGANCVSEMLGEEDMADYEAARGHDFSPVSRNAWEARHKVRLSTAEIARTMIAKERAADLDMLDGRSVPAVKYDEAEEAEESEEKTSEESSGASMAMSPVTPAGADATNDAWTQSSFGTFSKSWRLPTKKGRKSRGKSGFMSGGRKSEWMWKTAGAADASQEEGGAGEKGNAISSLIRRVTNSKPFAGGNATKTKAAALLNCKANKSDVESTMKDVLVGVFSATMVDGKDNLMRVRVPVSQWGKKITHSLTVKFEQAEGGCGIFLRRRFGDAMRISNDEFEWVASEIHTELAKSFSVEKPVYK